MKFYNKQIKEVKLQIYFFYTNLTLLNKISKDKKDSIHLNINKI